MLRLAGVLLIPASTDTSIHGAIVASDARAGRTASAPALTLFKYGKPRRYLADLIASYGKPHLYCALARDRILTGNYLKENE